MNFPQSGPLTEYSFTIPEAGDYNASLWLVDELGNEDIDSSRTVKAQFDNVPPQKFSALYPDTYTLPNGQQETTYAPVQPDFEWEDNGDFPSGIDKWHIFYRPSGTNDVRHYRTYDSDSVNYNQYGHIQMRDTNLPPLEDGFYDWWVEAQDRANLIEFSDTNSFGVDASPPDISHTPIELIDCLLYTSPSPRD